MRTLAPIAVLALAACAAPVDSGPTWQHKLAASGWKVGPEVASIVNFNFDGYELLDDTHLVIHSSVTRRVLLTVGPGCIELSKARRLGYQGSGSELARLDRVIVLDPVMPSHCFVESLNLLDRSSG